MQEIQGSLAHSSHELSFRRAEVIRIQKPTDELYTITSLDESVEVETLTLTDTKSEIPYMSVKQRIRN